ncbi:hypothetical protein K470DRAFT_192826, partial [Piedraia hortae CBS 480.64]
MSTRASNARNVRQRKLNPKHGLAIVDESDVEQNGEEESQPQTTVETGVEKAEEIEFHLQAVINASKAAKQSYIPTPDATKAKGIDYDELYPKVFKPPASNIRFSSTVEDCMSSLYCVDDEDVAFIARLRSGKDFEGHDRHDQLGPCSEDVFEEAINFFEQTSAHLQPFANVDNAPILSFGEMEQSAANEDDLSTDAYRWLSLIYPYWVSRKGSRPLMPTIKARMIDGTDMDDADPYVCFRRREVRQTRKTRGRDAQVVDKLKKLRLEFEQARQLVQMVVQREKSNSSNLEVSKKLFRQRMELNRFKRWMKLTAENDEDLLVDQRRAPKPRPRPSTEQHRSSTIRIRTSIDRPSLPSETFSLEELHAETEALMNAQVENQKKQHKAWNDGWIDGTMRPITPPLEREDPFSGW